MSLTNHNQIYYIKHNIFLKYKIGLLVNMIHYLVLMTLQWTG